MGQVKVATALPLLNYLRRSGSAHVDAIAPALAGSDHIATECWLGLYQQAIALTGDAALPLRVGASVQPSDYSMLGFAAMSCVTLGQAIEVMQRYERLVQDVNSTALAMHGDRAELQWLPYRGPISPIFMQLALASWAAVGRHLSGTRQAFEAHFTFAQPDHAHVYAEIFGRPPRFSQPMTRLIFERAFLDLPVVFGDPQTNQILLQKAEEQLLQADESEIVCQVRQRIASGRVSVEAVAGDLRMSPRKLQQQLTRDGSSFRKLLHEAQFQRAKAYLSDPAVSVSEVALLLGYSEQSPFQHAFKNWAGMTPGAYRKLRLRPAQE
ncbi:AraC family transcriptional regulator [Duganella radicis]|uniref:Helix-turn-helix domain-containing protein n=1 Tax=Duganella radicis TaxID=551988 RepID=A0A6L6PBT8_9BURK|nr:AraC family transcriptional regulator [Duganella radicis]MTV36578.1 helix-turn-helix domain-containing protein [Duganella radicis]